jgi:septin family protein
MLGHLFAGMIGIFLKDIYDKNGRAYEQNKYRELTYEKNLKEENALKIFNERKNELISSFSNKLVEDFSNNMNFCKQEMDKEYDKYTLELNKYIDQITEIENEENLFNSRINKSLENLAQNMGKNEVNHLNILLIGPSGVGKSCLINSILKSEKEEMAESGMTKPTTKTFNIYESNKIPNIRLIDSRGFEKGNYNVNSFVKEITNYVE